MITTRAPHARACVRRPIRNRGRIEAIGNPYYSNGRATQKARGAQLRAWRGPEHCGSLTRRAQPSRGATRPSHVSPGPRLSHPCRAPRLLPAPSVATEGPYNCGRRCNRMHGTNLSFPSSSFSNSPPDAAVTRGACARAFSPAWPRPPLLISLSLDRFQLTLAAREWPRRDGRAFSLPRQSRKPSNGQEGVTREAKSGRGSRRSVGAWVNAPVVA
jgi:hypothetical protein